MRKGLIVFLAAALVVAFALPAMAGMNASGFYRTKAYISNFYGSSSASPSVPSSPTIQKDALTGAFVEQRFRVKFDFGEENVKAVWYLESDAVWGDASGGAKVSTADTTGLGAMRNTGAGLGADRINTETKNIYVWFKVPDTSMDFTVGLQNQSDSYAGLLFGGADMAGVFAKGKFEPVSYRLGFAKLYENNIKKTDDSTLYVAEVKFAPTKEVNLGVNFYFLQDDTQKVPDPTEQPFVPSGGALNKVRVYIPGIDAAFKAGPLALTGFFLYETGKVDFVSPSSDVDIEGFAADVRGDVKLGPGNFFIEGLYLSGGDDPSNKYKSVVTLARVDASPQGSSAFSRTNMVLLLSDPDTINVSQCLIGCSGGAKGDDPGNGGRGIWHVAAGYSQKFTDKVSGSINAGYLAATKKLKSDPSFVDKEMGTEINARLNYNLMKGLDVGLVGAYAFIGDFFKTSATGSGSDPDDAWDLHARLNYSF